MTKFDVDSLDPNDSHSINISVYKPDGILSFWNWFTKRNKSDGQRKNIKFKINKEDLDRMKLSGFDFQKLQNLNLNDKNKSTRPCNVFAIPKTDLDPFLVKSLHPAMNTKTYVKRLISKSTISIRSKESCANLKYVRTVRSQKSVVNSVQSSKASFKVSMRSNTNVHLNSNQQPRNVFLKSVPTTILKSNTKKLLILGKAKSPKGNRKARTDATEHFNSQQHDKQSSNVIPMLLTRMKSMEEHLSDIENTTKKISQAVSQRNVVTKTNSRNDFMNTERNKQKAVKCVASHKIYSKNIQNAPRKNKKNRSKKLKDKSKTNNNETPKEAPSKLKPQINKGFAFNYFSDSTNDYNKVNHLDHSNINYNKPGLFFNQHGFTFPNKMSKVEFTTENTSNVGCDLFMSVVKALTETKGSTNLNQMDSSIAQNKLQHPNIGAEVGIINVGRSNCMSKSSFDWKHTSVSASSDPHISETGKSNQENIKVKKNMSVPFGMQDATHVLCDRNDILNQIFNPNMQKQFVLDLLRNNNTKSPLDQGEAKPIEDTQNARTGHPLETVELSHLDLGVNTESRKKNVNVNDIKSPKIGLQNKSSTQACLYEPKRTHSKEVIGSHKETNKLSLEQELSRSVTIDNRFKEDDTPTDVIKCSDIVTCTEKRARNMQPYEDDGSENTTDRRALCGVNKNAVSAAFTNLQEKQFKRTTICCPNAQKEPKVSITILVQDSMKGEVEMKSDILKNPTAVVSRDERIEQLSLKEEKSSPLSSCGPRGDHQLSAVQSNTYKTESVCSSEHLSSVSCTITNDKIKVPLPKITVESSYYTRTNNNFYVEVEDGGSKGITEEDLNLGSPGTYLNSEKRKVLEEKVLGPKQKRPLVQSVCEQVCQQEPLSPTRSCSNISNGLTTFDHLIETSFIRQETSYSKTKFNICKENKYNSRTLLQPLDSRKRSPFSDESLCPENNFDISTKYTSQQCVMYCRNNNVQNFKRPKFPLFQEQCLESTEFETRKQPFIVVHTPNNSSNNSLVNATNNNQRPRQKGVSLNTREDPILEVSEDESVAESVALNKQRMDGGKNNIEMKTSHTNLSNNLHQEVGTDIDGVKDEIILNDVDKPNRNDQEVELGDGQAQNEDGAATEENLRFETTSIQCDSDLSDYECKDDDSTINESRNRRGATTLTSPISQSILSSTLVQTDWSLVGITVDHLNCSSNKDESAGCQKRTVASQTDVMMDQMTFINKGLEDMHNCCKSCMKSCQFSELVACNVTVSQAKNVREDPHSSLESSQVVPFNKKGGLNEMETAGMLEAVTREKVSSSLQYTSNSSPIDEDISESNNFERAQTPTLTSSGRKHSYNFKLRSQYCENKSEESMQPVNIEALSHRCRIPCLLIPSDETVTSISSESSSTSTPGNMEHLYTVPRVQEINRGICSYYSSPQGKGELNLLSPKEKSRPDNSDSNFCRVLGDHYVEDEESSTDENCEGSQTSLVAPEAVEDSISERVDTRNDIPDKLVDQNKQPLEQNNLKQVLKSKKLNQNTKMIKERKVDGKIYTPNKPRKIEGSSPQTDYMINYLSVDRCNDEKKGNSVFSQT